MASTSFRCDRVGSVPLAAPWLVFGFAVMQAGCGLGVEGECGACLDAMAPDASLMDGPPVLSGGDSAMAGGDAGRAADAADSSPRDSAMAADSRIPCDYINPCASGCCDSSGTCQPGTSPTACGSTVSYGGHVMGGFCDTCSTTCDPVNGGGACSCTVTSNCPKYQACGGGKCGRACDSSGSCNGGCCATFPGRMGGSYSFCTEGNASYACGTGGGACVQCAMTQQCQNNSTCG